MMLNPEFRQKCEVLAIAVEKLGYRVVGTRPAPGQQYVVACDFRFNDNTGAERSGLVGIPGLWFNTLSPARLVDEIQVRLAMAVAFAVGEFQ